MAVINRESILAKAKAFVASDEFQKRAEGIVDKKILSGAGSSEGGDPYAAARKFIEVMQGEAASMGGKIDISMSHGDAYKFSKNVYQIAVDFSGNLDRPSLYPGGYSGVDNIIALFNNGYSAGNRVYGIWHGKQIASRQEREGLGFVSSAVNSFMSGYAKNYGVIGIAVDPAYK